YANVDVNEEKPPVDEDSALSFTMEGFHGRQPSALTGFYWAPGWNSVQAINKYQIEVGGEFHDGKPGKRLLEPSADAKVKGHNHMPAAFNPQNGEKLAVPIYYIYGSEELSAKSPAIQERIPDTRFVMNPMDAGESGVEEGESLSVNFNGEEVTLAVVFDESL